MMFTKRPSGAYSKKRTEEGGNVVKGTARRVIVVPSPDKKVFEEAIFIVREDYMRTAGITQSELLREARAAAGAYVGSLRPGMKKYRPVLTAMISALSGGGIAFALLKLLGG